MEIQSAVREQLKIVVVVLAEGSWTIKELNERLFFNTAFGCEIGAKRWDKVTEGLGCHGEYVENIEELEPALLRASDSAGSKAGSNGTYL